MGTEPDKKGEKGTSGPTQGQVPYGNLSSLPAETFAMAPRRCCVGYLVIVPYTSQAVRYLPIFSHLGFTSKVTETGR